MIPLCAECALPYSSQCHHMTFGSPCILSHTLPPLICSGFCPISLPHRNTFHFFSFSCLALAEEEVACMDAGSGLQACQLVGQPLHLSRDGEQVLEKFSISGALMLLQMWWLLARQPKGDGQTVIVKA